MHNALKRNLYFVRERVGMFKAVNEYDILDPETQELVMNTHEEIGLISKIFRLTDYKTLTPFNVILKDLQGNQIVRVHRGATFLRSTVTVFDENDNPVGKFRQKLFTIGAKMKLLDMNDTELGLLKGSIVGWDFTFSTIDGLELATITKKWAGVGKEMFTTADNYMLEVNGAVQLDNPVRMLILGAVICIDMVFKE